MNRIIVFKEEINFFLVMNSIYIFFLWGDLFGSLEVLKLILDKMIGEFLECVGKWLKVVLLFISLIIFFCKLVFNFILLCF